MNIVTQKEFQLNNSKIMKRVAAGETFQVTFHNKPVAKIVPILPKSGKPERGSYEAVMESLKHTVSGEGLPASPDYKKEYREHILKKYGPSE